MANQAEPPSSSDGDLEEYIKLCKQEFIDNSGIEFTSLGDSNPTVDFTSTKRWTYGELRANLLHLVYAIGWLTKLTW